MSTYSKGAIVLHWLIGLLIIGNLIGGLAHDYIPNDAGQRSFVMALHRSFGLTVLGLTLVRIGWRFANPPPAFPAYFTSGERVLAKIAHFVFYALMLALPLSGWIMADRSARSFSFFWLFDVPKFGVDKATAGFFQETHETLGWTMLGLLALHIAGVIKHLMLDRDNLLPRMGVGKAPGV